MIYFIYFVFCCGVRCRLKWQRNTWLRYNLFILSCFRRRADQPTSPRWITQHPLFQTICLQTEVLETAFVGLSSARNFSKCSEQIWHWLGLSKFALLIRTSPSLKSGLFLRAVDENLSLFWNLWTICLNNHPQHTRPFWSWCCFSCISCGLLPSVLL